jgi:hypothetical protein
MGKTQTHINLNETLFASRFSFKLQLYVSFVNMVRMALRTKSHLFAGEIPFIWHLKRSRMLASGKLDRLL